MAQNNDKAKEQLDKAKEMLGISDDRADEIFNDDVDHKEKKRSQQEG